MTPNLKKFVRELIALVPGETINEAKTDPPSVVVPACCAEVGDLVVYDDIDELTVCVGELHHTHFSEYCYEASTLDGRLTAAAREATRFVADVLEDRVEIQVRYKGEHCVGSSAELLVDQPVDLGSVSYPAAAWWFRATRTERYVWSGRVD